MNLNSLKFFYEVVTAGGYSATNRQTGQSRATLSRHITELENSLSTRLIERSTRSFRLTEQGRILYERCQEIFSQIDDAVMMVETLQHEPNGLVRIAIPPSLLHFHQLGEEILRYMENYPKVKIHIETSNRAVDLNNENFDFVIRARTHLDYPLDFVPILLAKMDLVLVMHPKWKNTSTNDLEKLLETIPAISWKNSGEFSIWNLISIETKKEIQIKFRPRMVIDDISTLRNAALNGLGMIMIPQIYVMEDLSLGRLIQVNCDAQPQQSLIHIVHLGHRGMRPAVRHLLDWLKNITQNLRD